MRKVIATLLLGSFLLSGCMPRFVHPEKGDSERDRDIKNCQVQAHQPPPDHTGEWSFFEIRGAFHSCMREKGWTLQE